MRSAAIALLSTALATLAGAYTTPVGNPTGNPIAKPTLGEIVPVGQPYTITWNPTSAGTVTLLLLRGPSENVVPLYPIAEKIDNSGTYSWLPSSSLESDTSRYGIQLIQDADGAYQYSTQFGISGGSGSSSSGSSSAKPTSSYASSSSYATVSSTATLNCTSSCPSYNRTMTSTSMSGTATSLTRTSTASLTPSVSANSTTVTRSTSSASSTGAATLTRSATSARTAASNASSTAPVGTNAAVKSLAVPLGTAAFTVLGLFAAYCL